MATVVPTVLATTPDEYSAMMERARALNARIHIDICDGQFADATTIDLAQVHVPTGTILDLHLMVTNPAAVLETALSLHPHLIIFHAESDGDVAAHIKQVQDLGVKAGVAILPQTAIAAVKPLVAVADHVLIFTGHLGHNGGVFQTDQLQKVKELRSIKPSLEISVDGGVNEDNAQQVADHDINVLYVGTFLQTAADPKVAYDQISRQAVVAAQ